MQLYNTLHRQKEEFVPIHSPQVKIYSCGPTVYSEPHIGNFKSMCFSDLLRNVLTSIGGYQVFQVMNFTDVGHLVSDGDDGEDKMQKGARKEGLTAREVAQKYEQKFRDAMTALRVEFFDVMPRATDHIQEQIDLVKSLENRGYTYRIDDGIYFDTSKDEDYGKLMGPNYKKHLEGLQSGARIADSGKKNPTDFALWKFSDPNESRDMERDSPWGKGFPGWHIECSAMSSKYLGNHFDIHVGGPEHISVHHSNEIAQSECGLDISEGQNWVNYWLHHGVLTVDGGKMSKSLGNGYTLTQLAEQDIDPIDLRMFFLTAQYGSYQDFTRDGLRAVKTARARMRKKIVTLMSSDAFMVSGFDKSVDAYQLLDQLHSSQAKNFLEKIIASLSDNINTPAMLAEINSQLGQDMDSESLGVLYRLDQTILKLDLFVAEKEESITVPVEIIALAEQRLAAKREKDYSLADSLRAQILDHGFVVKDTEDGFELDKV